MKTPPISLSELFQEQITELHATEKKMLKGFDGLGAAAQTDELRSALSPERSEQGNHVSRLKMLLDTLKLKASRNSNPISEELLKQVEEVLGFKKQKDLFKDIQIIHCVKLIYSFKISVYSSLHLMAENLDLKAGADVLKQSMEDSKVNFAYLLQIEQNIIYPAAKASS